MIPICDPKSTKNFERKRHVLKLYSKIVSLNLSKLQRILFEISRLMINNGIYLLWTKLKKTSWRTEKCLFYNFIVSPCIFQFNNV